MFLLAFTVYQHCQLCH